MSIISKTLLFILSLWGMVISSSWAMDIKPANGAIVIDGVADDASWQQGDWYPLDKHILGSIPTSKDFSGSFTLRWDEEYLYILAEITDDVLYDGHADPLTLYWDDDCLEIFVDEDASGGNHQFNFNAFAYHVALDNQAVDIGHKNADGSPQFLLLNDHLNSAWRRSEQSPNKIVWEVAVRLFDQHYQHLDKEQQPVKLHVGKTIGFMLAYCDNDGSKEREHFIGSTPIKAVNGDKNLGYITADVFDRLLLVK